MVVYQEAPFVEEAGDLNRSHHYRRSKDDWDNGSRINLQRQVVHRSLFGQRHRTRSVLDSNFQLCRVDQYDKDDDQQVGRGCRRRRSSLRLREQLHRLHSVTREDHAAENCCGMRPTIPAMMIMDIPLPRPFKEIWSPSHTRNMEPAVKIMATYRSLAVERPL